VDLSTDKLMYTVKTQFLAPVSMIRWMCGVKLGERKKSKEVKRTLSIGTSQFDDHKEKAEMVWTRWMQK